MMEALEQEVIQWAEEKGIFEKSTPIKQMEKMEEEVNELFTEVFIEETDNRDDVSGIKGELGDVLVTCIVQAQFHGLSLPTCLSAATDKITKRTGRMIDGQFVKDTH
jgi:NTP pyrophosphatase (non-canonical NTP hydrolase)